MDADGETVEECHKMPRAEKICSQTHYEPLSYRDVRHAAPRAAKTGQEGLRRITFYDLWW
jgi:hypothetical protein